MGLGNMFALLKIIRVQEKQTCNYQLKNDCDFDNIPHEVLINTHRIYFIGRSLLLRNLLISSRNYPMKNDYNYVIICMNYISTHVTIVTTFANP